MIDTLHQYSDAVSGHVLNTSTVVHGSESRANTTDSAIVDNVGSESSVGRNQSLSSYHTVPSIQQVNAITVSNQEAVGASLEHLAQLWTV